MLTKNQILINGKSSEQSVILFRDLVTNKLSKSKIYRAEVNYIKSKGMPNIDNPEDWPLQLYTEDGVNISVYNVTAGYYGKGPDATKTILELAGFSKRETMKVLYTMKDEVHCSFYKK